MVFAMETSRGCEMGSLKATEMESLRECEKVFEMETARAFLKVTSRVS